MASFFRRIYLKKAYKRISPLIKHKKTASYFAITLSFFSLSFFGFFAIRPTVKTAVSLVKSVSDYQKLNIELENKIASIIGAQSEYEKIRSDLPLIHKALPKNATFNSLARALERFATNSGVVINQLQIDNVPISNLLSDGKLKEYGYSLIATGTYPALSSYLSHITNWQRIVSVESLELSREGGTTSGTLRISLKGKTYYEP